MPNPSDRVWSIESGAARLQIDSEVRATGGKLLAEDASCWSLSVDGRLVIDTDGKMDAANLKGVILDMSLLPAIPCSKLTGTLSSSAFAVDSVPWSSIANISQGIQSAIAAQGPFLSSLFLSNLEPGDIPFDAIAGLPGALSNATAATRSFRLSGSSVQILSDIDVMGTIYHGSRPLSFAALAGAVPTSAFADASIPLAALPDLTSTFVDYLLRSDSIIGAVIESNVDVQVVTQSLALHSFGFATNVYCSPVSQTLVVQGGLALDGGISISGSPLSYANVAGIVPSAAFGASTVPTSAVSNLPAIAAQLSTLTTTTMVVSDQVAGLSNSIISLNARVTTQESALSALDSTFAASMSNTIVAFSAADAVLSSRTLGLSNSLVGLTTSNQSLQVATVDLATMSLGLSNSVVYLAASNQSLLNTTVGIATLSLGLSNSVAALTLLMASQSNGPLEVQTLSNSVAYMSSTTVTLSNSVVVLSGTSTTLSNSVVVLSGTTTTLSNSVVVLSGTTVALSNSVVGLSSTTTTLSNSVVGL